MTKINNIAITCRRWFQKSYGNTYHSVQIVDRETGRQLAYDPFTYGYERQCIQTAVDMLKTLGIKSEYHTLERKAAYVNIIDVNRKKDL